MTKAYSSKALPAGTVIREWRLEDVLGVGGFGIVYKGRGIYFGELVAIKEYFPSSIAERDGEDTVVPIGSDVEEVHALGLKKFVEEAKLLWNLSTPTRHPNIVSVRSLFEIHGTAYMVMDFEDGVSLSKLLKDGRRFNERSLWNIVKPVAEGLDRAHRVGVLHRDIKPPNILITDDNRPVLIDFGSARFEAAEATSTSVTFHTPPYAAVEQYVKTYPQGPWTDVYALAVVLYECITGEKPPEVLERLHGGLGTPLAEGTWPGFSKRFLQAVDTGMTIKPSERPQSIREWLDMFGKKDVEPEIVGDDEPTRFFAHEVTSEEIVPVAPPAPGLEQKKEHPETGVPDDPKEVQFKRVGEETGASKKSKKSADAAATAAAAATLEARDRVAKAEAVEAPPAKPEPAPAPRKPSLPAADKAKEPSEPWYKNQRTALFAGAGALVLALAAVVGVFMNGSDDAGGSEEIPGLNEPAPVVITDIGGLAPAERALADDARKAGVPMASVDGLTAAADQLDKQFAALQPIMNDPAQATAAAARLEEMKRTAAAANTAFAKALLVDAESRALRLPVAASAGPGRDRVRTALAELKTTVDASSATTDPTQSINAARMALAKSLAFGAALSAARSAEVAAKKPTETAPKAVKPTETAATPVAPTAAPTPADAASSAASSAGASAAKKTQLNSTVSSGRALAKQVIASGSKENARLAKNYDKYLANVADSARGARTDREMDQLIKQANQTKAYIVFLSKQPAGN